MKTRILSKTNLWVLLLAFTMFGSLKGYSQNEIDALRFSDLTTTGTARSIGAGGAFTAVGGDFSAGVLNPAGYGVYRRSEFVITPVFRNITNDATYIGATNSDSKGNFGFANLGLVITSPVRHDRSYKELDQDGSSGLQLKSFSFAIGMNQVNNFHRRIFAESINRFNGIGDAYASSANALGGDPANFDAYTNNAYQTFLINPDQSNQYFPSDTVPLKQSYYLTEYGRTNLYNISLAGNFSDKLFLGASINIADLYYKAEYQFYEQNNNPGAYIDSTFLNYQETNVITHSGTGVNVSVGFIAQPINFLRIGASITSPTYYSMTLNDAPYSQLSIINGPSVPYNNASSNTFDYSFHTPYKADAGVMLLLPKKLGFVSADFEITDYSTAKLSSSSNPNGTDYNFAPENNAIKAFYTQTYNWRFGAELRLVPKFYLRAGYAIYGSPYSSAGKQYADLSTYDPVSGNYALNTLKGEKDVYSGGLGYRSSHFTIDVAYVYQTSKDIYALYLVPDNYYTLGLGTSPYVENNKKVSSVVLTLGFPFGAR